MVTNLLHIGDAHFGPGDRNEDRFRALDQIVTYGLSLHARENLGAWLWPGDLGHARQAIADKNRLEQILVGMAAVAPVVITYGNHDVPGDLDTFARLRGENPVYVIDRPGCVRIRLATMQFATLFCLPYPTKAGLTALGVAPPDVIDVAAGALDHIFMQAAGELEHARARGDLTLMIGHVNVAGSIASVGQPNIGREIEIGAAHLDRLGAVYKGLNHIHKGQTIADAHYPGSICRLNWGEVEPKRVLQVGFWQDVAVSPASSSWRYTVTPVPIDVAPMYHVEGRLTRAGFDWRVTAGENGETLDAPETWEGCEVRVRYHYPAGEKSILDEALVRAPFAAALRLEVEPIAEPDRALRAPEVAAARSLAEKVTAYGQVADVAVTDRLLEKLGRLETTDPEALVAAVADEASAVARDGRAVAA